MTLPPGQRERDDFPRFGLTPMAKRFPRQTARIDIEVAGLVEQPLQLTDALQGLPRVEQTCDFHCVTTWSRRRLRWGGVRFIDFHQHVVLPRARPHAQATLVAVRGQDGARTGLLLADLLQPDVLLADTLDGAPLTVEHGAPVRLVAPAHYGYKWGKHLCRLEFRREADGYPPTGFAFMDHPRARVALEERARGLPGWLVRVPYRLFIPGTVARFAKALAGKDQPA